MVIRTYPNEHDYIVGLNYEKKYNLYGISIKVVIFMFTIIPPRDKMISLLL